MTSCSEKSDYHFKNPADALEQYRDFHHGIAAVPQTKAEQLADFICQWQELSDTVYNYIKKDPAFTAHASLSMTFQETSDSVRAELFRLAVDCSLSDVAYVKMHTSPYRDDADLDATKKKATTFYSALDKQPIYNKWNAREKIELYRSFLAATKEHGINNQKELLSFIEEEDRHFRTFLAHIDECSSIGMTEITNHTADICSAIYKSASRNKMPASETLVLMSMRTDRRLILNAQVCRDALKRGKIRDAIQANAYLWMILQPYLSMDALAIAMLTPEQAQLMTDIAKDYPAIITRLEGKHLVNKEVSNKIPAQLMRLYISTL